MAIKKVIVLYGGKSSEREVSLESGKYIYQHFSFDQISNEGMPITRFQQRAINEGRSIHTFLLTVLKK